MALSKLSASLAPTQVNAGLSESAPFASGPIDVGYGINGTMRIANRSSAPTAGAWCAVQGRGPESTSDDDWRYVVPPVQAGIEGSKPYDFPFSVEMGIAQIRYVAFGNATNHVDFSVQAGRVTAM